MNTQKKLRKAARRFVEAEQQWNPVTNWPFDEDARRVRTELVDAQDALDDAALEYAVALGYKLEVD